MSRPQNFVDQLPGAEGRQGIALSAQGIVWGVSPQGGKGLAMPTTVSSRSPGTMNPTRQQLDELDALLQRMLELPVAKVESPESADTEETPPVAEPVRSRPSPVSYMVIETASPRPLPLASGFTPQPSPLTPRLVPVKPMPEPEPQVPEPEAVAPVGEPEEVPPTPTLPHKGGGGNHSTVPTNGEAGLLSPSPLVGEGGGGGGEDEAWVPLRSTWQPSAQTWPPLADSWQQAQSVPQPQPQPEITPPEENVDT